MKLSINKDVKNWDDLLHEEYKKNSLLATDPQSVSNNQESNTLLDGQLQQGTDDWQQWDMI